VSVRRKLFALAGVSVLLGVALVARPGEAVVTRTFTLDSQSELSAGVLDRVAVTADGQVVPGADIARVGLPEPVGSVWSILDLGDGSALVGTGVDGRVYRVQDGAATLYAQTDALVVTSLARGGDGAIYAATLPDGKLYQLVAPTGGRPQAPRLVAELPDTRYIWAVAWDPARRALLCATGPEGKLFAVDPRLPAGGNATVVFDSDEPHLYSLALGRGEAFVGSGGGHAVVFAVRGGAQARVVARLAGDEVKALAVVGDEVFAAANEFAEPPAPPGRTALQGRLPSPGGVSATRPRPGKGSLYRIRSSGLAERVYTNPDSHLTALEWNDARREAWVALGVGGRVVAVADDRTARVALDVDEAQVLALDLTGRAALFGTGDAGGLYRVTAVAPSGATWNSKVLDATSPARWGAVRWRGAGALDWEARSGNTEAPDNTWSAWAALDADGVIASPASRYVQVRARFGRAADTAIRAVTVYYLPENQRAVVTDVTAAAPETKAGDARQPAVKLGWKVENPDGDALRYRLRFRGDAESTWRPVLRNQEWVTETSFTWSIDGLAEGWYRVEVEATDEAANPADGATSDRRVSEPLLVDNTAPTVTVRVEGGRVAGDLRDGASAVVRVELAVDGGEWRPARSADGLFDEREEALAAPLPATLAAGEHTVTVRAYDEAGNVGVGSARFRR
jgi:hypothetical protein